VFAAPVQRYTDAAAAQLSDRAAYARAVLGPELADRGTTRPYRFDGAGPLGTTAGADQ
jgi:multicomponent K+:H+ antiporter subunit D